MTWEFICHEILECDVAWKSVTLTSVAVGSDHTRAVWGSEDKACWWGGKAASYTDWSGPSRRGPGDQESTPGWALELTPVILLLWRLMQEDCECEVRLGHIARFEKENQKFPRGGSDEQLAGQPRDDSGAGSCCLSSVSLAWNPGRVASSWAHGFGPSMHCYYHQRLLPLKTLLRTYGFFFFFILSLK